MSFFLGLGEDDHGLIIICNFYVSTLALFGSLKQVISSEVVIRFEA